MCWLFILYQTCWEPEPPTNKEVEKKKFSIVTQHCFPFFLIVSFPAPPVFSPQGQSYFKIWDWKYNNSVTVYLNLFSYTGTDTDQIQFYHSFIILFSLICFLLNQYLIVVNRYEYDHLLLGCHEKLKMANFSISVFFFFFPTCAVWSELLPQQVSLSLVYLLSVHSFSQAI